MPRVRRKGFKARGLTGAQRDILLFGYVLIAHGEPGFESEDEERKAWQRYGPEMIALLNHPWRKPAGYYKHELHIDPPSCWPGELAALLDHNVITADDIVRIEACEPMLSGQHQDAYCGSFDDPASIQRVGLDPDMAESMAEEFEAAARWHQWRRRPEVAERYTARADLLRAWMGDGNLSRGFNYDGNHYSA